MNEQNQQLRLRELGDFLRTRRNRVTPESVELPRGARRRSPGLRRAEVAQLAGVSVDWYTWLEQGRPITASEQVLDRLATVLRLDPAERAHLFLLARQHGPAGKGAASALVSPMLQRFLDQQGCSPAVATDARWNVVAWNTAACRVFGDYEQMTSRERNTVWRLFTTPAYRQLFADWEGYAKRVLAQFRASSSRFLGDAEMTELVDDLMRRSPEFQAWWSNHEVQNSPAEHKAFIHPQAGALLFDRLTFQVVDTPALTVTIYLAAQQTDTAQKLAQLLKH